MRIQIPILSFLALPLVLLPLPWHWRVRNIPTLTMITCIFLLNLIHGVNSIVWSGSVVTRIPVWCDITTKFAIGVQVALPAASLCITRHLECVASLRQTVQTAGDKRRRRIFELCLCVGFPALIMALHYIVQGHRFDIAEDFGCMPTTYHSWPAILIVYVPPPFLAVVSLIYAGFAFAWFMNRRASFAEHLKSQNSGLTTTRYIRLMGLAVTEILVSTGLGAYVLAITLQDSHLRVWDNWADVHSNFSRIAQYPRVLVPEFYWDRLLMTWYIPPIASLTFFTFFGFGHDAMVEYNRFFVWVRVHVFRQAVKPSNDSVLPTFSAPPRSARVVRLDDLDMISIDEKWDDDDVHDSDASSLCPPSAGVPSDSRSQNAETLPSRPLSAPPSDSPRSTDPPSTSRPLSLDVSRGVVGLA